jgi:hypothetical protein
MGLPWESTTKLAEGVLSGDRSCLSRSITLGKFEPGTQSWGWEESLNQESPLFPILPLSGVCKT